MGEKKWRRACVFLSLHDMAWHEHASEIVRNDRGAQRH